MDKQNAVCVRVYIYIYIHARTQWNIYIMEYSGIYVPLPIYTHRYIHTIKYHSAIRRSEVVTHATTRMNLGNIMLGKRSQTQRVTYSPIPLNMKISRINP